MAKSKIILYLLKSVPIMVFSIIFVTLISVSIGLTKPAEINAQAIATAKININTATVDELLQLKRIGPSLAQRVIEYRETNGSFKEPKDILKVKGLGEKFWAANKDIITVVMAEKPQQPEEKEVEQSSQEQPTEEKIEQPASPPEEAPSAPSETAPSETAPSETPPTEGK